MVRKSSRVRRPTEKVLIHPSKVPRCLSQPVQQVEQAVAPSSPLEKKKKSPRRSKSSTDKMEKLALLNRCSRKKITPFQGGGESSSQMKFVGVPGPSRIIKPSCISVARSKVRRVPRLARKRPMDKPLCSYLHRYCMRPRLDGYLYCMTHILQDKNAPFRRCSFIHPQTRKRCFNAAPKNERRDSLCPWHRHIKQKQRLLQLSKKPVVKKPQPKTFSSLLEKLERYCEDKRHNPKFAPDKEKKGSKQYQPLPSRVPTDMKSLGSSGSQMPRLNEAWSGLSDESDSDFDESDREEPLQHAGVYTYEEVVRIYRDKLIHLQSLYVEQFKWLFYSLKEKRRDFLHALKNAAPEGVVDVNQMTEEEKEMRQNYKATYRYHRHSGQEAVLRWKYMQKRREFCEGSVKPATPRQLCVVIEDGKKCTKEAIVMSTYCPDHILLDPQQVLFKPCPGGHGECWKPIVPYSDDSACLAHTSCVRSPLTTSDSERSPERMYIAPSSSSPVPGPSGIQRIRSDAMGQEPELFHSMDDIASLGLDAVVPGSLFGLNQYGIPGESTDSAYSDDEGSYMGLRAPEILCRKPVSDSDSD